jgi:hypothetical protein
MKYVNDHAPPSHRNYTSMYTALLGGSLNVEIFHDAVSN